MSEGVMLAFPHFPSDPCAIFGEGAVSRLIINPIGIRGVAGTIPEAPKMTHDGVDEDDGNDDDSGDDDD